MGCMTTTNDRLTRLEDIVATLAVIASEAEHMNPMDRIATLQAAKASLYEFIRQINAERSF
jgi:hypothetical protein